MPLGRNNADVLATDEDDTLADGVDITLGTTTGTKIGTATTQKLAVFNATPVVRQSAYTQTYSTASKTHSNPTASAVATTAATSDTPFGYSEAQANAIVTAVNALVADVANVKQVLNSVIDDLQTYGWFA